MFLFPSKFSKPFFILFSILIIFTTYCCHDDEILPPDIILNQDFKAPIAIAFLNADTLNLENVPQVTVRLVDPDNMVRASGNIDFETIEVTNGVMNLGLLSNAFFDAQTPYRFRIIAEAEGYTPAMQTILIDDESPRYFPIFMNMLEAPAPGISTHSSNLLLSDGIILNDTLLTPEIQNNQNVTISIAIQAGTRLFSNNQLVSGESVQVNFTFGDPLNQQGRRIFPNGFLFTDAFDTDGILIASPSNPSTFFTTGWVTMEMNVGSSKIDSFDLPLIVQMEINSNQTNPNTFEPYSVGDPITVWSLDDIGNWREENTTFVAEGSNLLQATFEMTHLSTWSLGHRKNPCLTDISITVNNQTSSPQLLYGELVTANSGQNLGISVGQSNYAYNYVPGLQTITYSRVPISLELAFFLYDNSTTPTNRFGASDVFMTCDNPLNILVVNNITSTIRLRVTVNVDGTPEPICHNAMWYKKCMASCNNMSCSSVPYLYGGHLMTDGIDAGIVDTPIPIVSTEYCMRVWYSNSNGILGVQQEIDFDINFEQARNAPTTKFGSDTNSAVKYQFDNTEIPNIYRVFIEPSSGLTEVTSCPP